MGKGGGDTCRPAMSLDNNEPLAIQAAITRFRKAHAELLEEAEGTPAERVRRAVKLAEPALKYAQLYSTGSLSADVAAEWVDLYAAQLVDAASCVRGDGDDELYVAAAWFADRGAAADAVLSGPTDALIEAERLTVSAEASLSSGRPRDAYKLLAAAIGCCAAARSTVK